MSLSILFLSGCSLVSGGADGGVFRSDNGGAEFAQKATIDEKTKISGTDVLSLAVNPQNGSEVYIGTKSSGIFKTTDSGEKWQAMKVSEKTPSKAYAIAIDPANPSVVFAAAIVDGRGKIIKSTDSGANWKDVYAEPSSGSFVLSLALDPLDPKNIWAGTTKKQIVFSSNGGDSWKNIFEAQGEVHKIAVDNSNPEIAYFAVFQGGLLITKNGGTTFENIESGFSGRQQLRNPTAIITDPTRSGWAYAGTDTGLWRTRDAGDNWDLIKVLNRPQENAIRGIAVNPGNPDEIIYGAAQAFYKSVDGGQSWATVQFGGSRTIETIAYNRQNPGMIYAGTNKR